MVASGPLAASRRFPTLAKYEVVEELGHGGMATVYRAHDARLGRDVAIKVIHPHLRDSTEVATRFAVEAKAVAKLRHPNIVEVYDVSADDEHEQYLVVELLRGRTLRRLLQQGGALPPEVAASLAIELLGALSHAHGAGVIHRDVKPENVMVEHVVEGEGGTTVTSPGERVKIKLTDFGIAKLLDAQGVTSTGQVLGSPAHMAPEQIEGGEVDARADLFGLGVLLYECMVGHLPFEGTNPAQVLRRVLDGTYPSAERERPTVGKRWSTILDRALAHDPADRFKTAAEMRDALLDELKRLGVSSPLGEIEAYSDDPEGYLERHDKALIATLCDLAGKARRAGDAQCAAADYNRALAYAPHDRELLRIVSSMHRAEARARFLKKYVPLVIGGVTFGIAAFFVTRALRGKPVSLLPPKDTRPPASAVASASAAPSASVQPKPVALLAPLPAPAPAPRPAQKPAERHILVGSVRPPFGVTIAVDGEPAVEASPGLKITLDTQPHILKLTCARDACEPDQRALPGGDKDEAIDVVMRIRPAILTVVGDPEATYRIVEDPTVTLHAGAPMRVTMKQGSVPVQVVELPSNRTERVTLVAGKETRATFDVPAAP